MPTVWLLKAAESGEVVGTVPVPVKLTVCGLPLALSVTVSVALRLSVAVGANVTLIAQLKLAASEVEQLFV